MVSRCGSVRMSSTTTKLIRNIDKKQRSDESDLPVALAGALLLGRLGIVTGVAFLGEVAG